MKNTETGAKDFDSPKDTENKPDYSEMLPDDMLKIVDILSKVLAWEADYCLLSMIVTAGGAIGNARVTSIGPYGVFSILYGCLVGPPSVNKSEPLKFAVAPLRKIFAQMYADYQLAYADWEQMPDKENTEEPKLAEMLFSDITIEKVAINLQGSPKGAILAADELKGWFVTFGRQRGSNAEQTYIELFNCTPLTVSRMSRKTVYVRAPYLSVIGTTQPDVIHRTFKDAANNGLKERLLFVYPDAKPKPWNREANLTERNAAQEAWDNIISRLYGLQAGPDGKAIHLPMSQAAQDVLYDWQEANTQRKITNPDAAAMLGKADIICPRLALILALIDNPDTEYIVEQDAIRAVNLMEYFIQHGQKAMQVIKEGEPGKPNAKQLLFAALPDHFTTEDAYRQAAEVGIPQRSCRRYLQDDTFFIRIKQGEYEKANL